MPLARFRSLDGTLRVLMGTGGLKNERGPVKSEKEKATRAIRVFSRKQKEGDRSSLSKAGFTYK